MAKAKKTTTDSPVKVEPVVLPKSGLVLIEGIGGGLKGIYSVSSEAANALIKKGFATLKNK